MTFTQLGAAVDPDTVTLVVRDGSHHNVTYVGLPTIVRDAVGSYHAEIFANLVGIWSYRWAGSGSVVAAVEARFNVQPSIV